MDDLVGELGPPWGKDDEGASAELFDLNRTRPPFGVVVVDRQQQSLFGDYSRADPGLVREVTAEGEVEDLVA
ncbi:hypothetical protein PD653_1124 [Nocardioides sp. PD653]|nr:hypothetical protein PD653_1124 [Nocardioides sp. PD653]